MKKRTGRDSEEGMNDLEYTAYVVVMMLFIIFALMEEP